MKVYGNKKFGIYIKEIVYPPPHCHVRFCDGSEISVTIPLIEPMYGGVISDEVRTAIENNLDKLADTWEQFHPAKHKKRKTETK